mmetsp:Transcript_19138/g.39465  ORF Transcript_19138/g.39465 Transcript_19138/m.39465 type:complete len:84 (+) Transcript_19138:365-616(+)
MQRTPTTKLKFALLWAFNGFVDVDDHPLVAVCKNIAQIVTINENMSITQPQTEKRTGIKSGRFGGGEKKKSTTCKITIVKYDK